MTAEVATFYQTNLAHTGNVEENDAKLKRRLSLLNETNELTNTVLNTWESTVTESAKKGVGKVNILVYDTSTTAGKRTSFLMRGPRNVGLSFFTKQGIVPVFQRIVNAIESRGFRVYHWYPGKSKNVVEVVWLNPSGSKPYDFVNQIEASYEDSNTNYFSEELDKFYDTFLLSTIRETFNARNNKIQRSVLENEERSNLSTEINTLLGKITENWQAQVTEAKGNSKNFVNLFRYDGNSEEGKRYSYLINGPRNLRYRFFYRNGIKSLMVSLREQFEPHFSVSHKYFSKPDADGNVLGNVIELRWV